MLDRLPPELRTIIYRWVFVYNTLIPIFETSGRTTALLRTCRLFRRGTHILWRKSVLMSTLQPQDFGRAEWRESCASTLSQKFSDWRRSRRQDPCRPDLEFDQFPNGSRRFIADGHWQPTQSPFAFRTISCFSQLGVAYDANRRNPVYKLPAQLCRTDGDIAKPMLCTRESLRHCWKSGSCCLAPFPNHLS